MRHATYILNHISLITLSVLNTRLTSSCLIKCASYSSSEEKIDDDINGVKIKFYLRINGKLYDVEYDDDLWNVPLMGGKCKWHVSSWKGRF